MILYRMQPPRAGSALLCILLRLQLLLNALMSRLLELSGSRIKCLLWHRVASQYVLHHIVKDGPTPAIERRRFGYTNIDGYA